MTMPPLHQAVLDDDVQKVFLFKDDPKQCALKDLFGFTARELAMLLGKKASLQLLEPNQQKMIKIHKEGLHSVKSYTVAEFEAHFSVCYTKTSIFKDYKLLQKVIKNCPWLLKSTIFGTEHRRLGAFYRRKIFSGFIEDVAICFINSIKGYGLFSQKEIPAHTCIGTYVGFVRQIRRFHPELNNYCLHYSTRFCSFHYFVIDAQNCANETRFINHSKTPNLRPFCLVDRGLLHIGFFATRAIKKGEELTFDYGTSFKGNKDLPMAGLEPAPGYPE